MGIDQAVRETSEELEKTLGEIELDVLANYTLADAIREGAGMTKQSRGWGDGIETACALTAAMTAAKARGYL